MNTNYSISNFYELTPEKQQSVQHDLTIYLLTFGTRFKIGMSNCFGYFDKPMAQETVAIFNIHDVGYFAQSIGTTVPALLSDYEIISNGYAEYFIFNEYENTLTLCTEDYLSREYFTVQMLEGMVQSAIEWYFAEEENTPLSRNSFSGFVWDCLKYADFGSDNERR